MDSQTTPARKPRDIGLFIRRLLVGGLPLLVIVGGIVLLFGMSALKPKPEEKEEVVKAPPVLVAEAVQQDARLTVTTQGEVTPRTEIKLVPQVAGKITFVSPSFIEGGAFRKGDTLLQIESEEYRLRVVQARANVAQARTRLRSEEAEAAVARKEADELGLDAANSSLARREPQLAEARAMIDSAEAALGEAELQLARTAIRAPFNGRVRRKNVDIGQYVAPGAELGEVFAVQVMQVALPLTDSELGQLGLEIGFLETDDVKGPAVTFSSLVSGRPHQWSGRIVRTDSGYDPQTRVLFAYAEVEDPYGTGADEGTPMASGLFVSAYIEGRALEDAVVVPRTALRGENQVYVVTAEDELEIRPVNVASTDRDRVVLTGGLAAGERVVTSPVRGAADGMKVDIVDPDAPETPDVTEEAEEALADNNAVAQTVAN
ncbi:efflux RND transporter periplasmic adaptor subunit [Parvularcula sp. IMCC14364]|uniref:efflux RND transporter periplasmic adaptor subunit n=1 Tax=Parvularcula sp. IMCC14364 TaxID=3067902 RepID=UPI00274179C1|nr:efflux RND transporter periplasmic adaptor subunit [Parvularcula sp. IMCC14364]